MSQCKCRYSVEASTPATPVQRSYNYDSAGRERPHPAGHYLIPAHEFNVVVARAQFDKRLLNCYPFVPLAERSPCLPCPPPGRKERR
jgi:hypothetical protein